MSAGLGAHVKLDRAPLGMRGLSYTEIWISESQERMVARRPPRSGWAELRRTLPQRGHRGGGDRNLRGNRAIEIELWWRTGRRFVDALPARWTSRCPKKAEWLRSGGLPPSAARIGRRRLASGVDARYCRRYTVASKEWVIRRYDHEVQGGSVIKPLTGVKDDGPSDAAVVNPVLGSWKGLAIANGINPWHHGDLDPYWMAAAVIGEAVRNAVAVQGRSEAHSHSRQLLLGQHKRPGRARVARPAAEDLPRCGPRVRHAVHRRQGLVE